MRGRDFGSRDSRTMCIQLQPGSAVLTWLWRLPGGRSPNWAGSPAGGEPAEGAWIVRAEAGPTRSWKSREGVNLRNGGSWTQCGRWVYGWVEEMEARSLSLIRGCRWTSCLRSQCSSVLCPENVLDLIPGKFQRLRAEKGEAPSLEGILSHMVMLGLSPATFIAFPHVQDISPLFLTCHSLWSPFSAIVYCIFFSLHWAIGKEEGKCDTWPLSSC